MPENLEAKVGNFSSKNIWNRAIKFGRNALICSLLGASLLGCMNKGGSSGGSSSGGGGGGGSPGGSPSGNHAPVIYSSPLIQVNENSQYSYDVNASDSDGDVLTYSATLTGSPSWTNFSINSSTGVITGTAPEVSADTNYSVNVRVSDGKTYSEQPYTLIVKNISSTPTQQGTKVLSDSVLATITSVKTNAINFSQPVPDVAIGNIVVAGISAGTPYGYLAEVTGISSDRKTLLTQPSSLEKAVSSASFSMRKTLLPSDVASLRALNGVSESNSLTGYNFGVALNNVVIFDADGNLATTNDQIAINGRVDFNVDVDMDFNISGNRLTRLFFQTATDIQTNITLKSSFAGLFPQGDKSVGDYLFVPFVAGYTPPPVTFPIIVTLIGDVSAGSTAIGFQSQAGVNQTATLTAGIDYNNGVWTPTNAVSSNFTYSAPTNPLANSYAEAHAGPSIGLFLYGFLGPYGRMNGTLEYSSDSSRWDLKRGLEASLGVKTQILGINILDYSNKVVDYKATLASGNFAPQTPTTVTIQPGTADGKDAFVKWSNFPGSSVPDTNFNTSSLELFKGYQYNGDALIQFPFSSIPVGSTIDSAKLNVYGYCSSNFPISTLTVDLKKITSSWSESSVTWNTKPSYDAAIISSIEVPRFGPESWHEFDVKPLAQTWVNGGINRGLVLLLGEDDSGCAFKSSEYANSSQRPKLVVSYH